MSAMFAVISWLLSSCAVVLSWPLASRAAVISWPPVFHGRRLFHDRRYFMTAGISWLSVSRGRRCLVVAGISWLPVSRGRWHPEMKPPPVVVNATTSATISRGKRPFPEFVALSRGKRNKFGKSPVISGNCCAHSQSVQHFPEVGDDFGKLSRRILIPGTQGVFSSG